MAEKAHTVYSRPKDDKDDEDAEQQEFKMSEQEPAMQAQSDVVETQGAAASITQGIDVADKVLKLHEGIKSVINDAENISLDHSNEIRNDINKMKKEYGNGVSSLITIDNRSACRLIKKHSCNYSGHVWKYPMPGVINPGSNACFLHVKASGAATGSIGYAEYKIQYFDSNEEEFIDGPYSWKFGWHTPFSGSNKCPGKDNAIMLNKKKTEYGPFHQTAEVGQSSSPIYEFILTQHTKKK